MRAVIQRVRCAEVAVAGAVVGATGGPGLLVFLGVMQGDTPAEADWVAQRLASLRLFPDPAEPDGRLELALPDLPGAGTVLLISQFTLFGTLRKGTRPSFHRAAPPAEAVPLYERVRDQLALALGRPVATGVFGALMHISAEHDGPVTLVLDSREKDF